MPDPILSASESPPAAAFLDPKVLSAISSLELIAQMVVEGFISGLQKSPYHGFNVEFTEHRHYMPGDEIRHIDWKVLAKSDRLYIKRFEEETNLRGYLLLDISKSMSYGSEGTSKIQYARYLAASLAYLMLHQRDGAGLFLFDGGVRSYVPPRARMAHLQSLIEVLQTPPASEATEIEHSFTEIAERIPRRGLIMVISDLLDDPEKVLTSLRHLRHHRHEVIVFHIVHPDELELPFKGYHRFQDMEGGPDLLTDPGALADEYRERVKRFLDQYKEGCATDKIDYVLMNTGKPLDTALFAYLAKRYARTRR